MCHVKSIAYNIVDGVLPPHVLFVLLNAMMVFVLYAGIFPYGGSQDERTVAAFLGLYACSERSQEGESVSNGDALGEA